MTETQFTKEELILIAKNQSLFCLIIFIGLCFRISIVGLSVMLPKANEESLIALVLGMLLIVVSIGVFISAVIVTYRLAKAQKFKNPVLYSAGLIVPLINLFIILRLIANATKILRAHNIRVGIMGANKDDLRL